MDDRPVTEPRRGAWRPTAEGSASADDARRQMERWIAEALVYVPSVARRFIGCGIAFEELLAAGNLGLVQAALRYDETRGIKFITYADWWIRKSILKTIQEQSGPVRLPRYRLEQLRELNDARLRFAAEHGREPITDELARYSGRSSREVELLLSFARQGVSLEQSVGTSEDVSLGSTLASDPELCPQDTLIRRDFRHHVRRLLGRLDERECQVLLLRYGFGQEPPRTLRQVGRSLGISRERVRQIERRALQNLRDLMFVQVG